MHLVDDVDLVFSLRRGIGYLVDDLTDIVHTVVGSRVDLDDIHAGSRRNGLTNTAFPTGAVLCGVFAIHCFRKIFATVVLPVPLVPVNRYAWPIRFARS